MLHESEFALSLPREWLLTPNFGKQVLGIIDTFGGLNTQRVSEGLTKANKLGKNKSFPPNFNPHSLKDVREILLNLEEHKLVLHITDPSVGDFWGLSAKGSKFLNGHSQVLTEEFKREVEEQKEGILEREKKRGEEIDKDREQRLKDREDEERIERERREAARAERQRVKEKQREQKKAERQRERDKKKRERDEARRIAREAREAERQRIAKLREKEKEKEKLKKINERNKNKLNKKKIEKTKQTIAPPIPKPEEVKKDPLLVRLESEFKDACERLKKHRYSYVLPLFKEGENGDGTQVYFSQKGYLCYKPREKEFPMDLDIALDIYGYEKISNALKQALQMRHF